MEFHALQSVSLARSRVRLSAARCPPVVTDGSCVWARRSTREARGHRARLVASLRERKAGQTRSRSGPSARKPTSGRCSPGRVRCTHAVPFGAASGSMLSWDFGSSPGCAPPSPRLALGPTPANRALQREGESSSRELGVRGDRPPARGPGKDARRRAPRSLDSVGAGPSSRKLGTDPREVSLPRPRPSQ